MYLPWLSSTLLLGPLFASPAPQGPNCASAQPIAGLGTFAYDTSTALGTSFGLGACAPPGGSEGYFQWTALAAGDVRFSLEVPNPDRRFTAFAGTGCSASCLGSGSYDSDLFGTYRRLWIPNVQAGATYLLRIGNVLQPGGVGSLHVEWDPCFAPFASDDGFEENDTCSSATALLPGTYPDLLVQASDYDFYEVVIPPMIRGVVRQVSVSSEILIQEMDGTCAPIGVLDDSWSYDNASFDPRAAILRIRPIFGQTCAPYDLEYVLEPSDCMGAPAADDLFEDNDTLATAAALLPGSYAALFVSSSDPDYYRIDLAPGQQLRIESSASTGTLVWERYQGSGLPWVVSGTQVLYTNYSQQPESVVLRPLLFAVTGSTWCTSYDASLTVQNNPCMPLGPDVGFAHQDFPIVSDGLYPNVLLEPVTLRYVCVAPGADLDMDFHLERAEGLLEVTLTCTLPLSACFFLPVVATASGQSFSLHWSNTATEYRTLQVALEYSGGTVLCNHVDWVVSGSSGCDGVLASSTFCAPGNLNVAGHPTTLFATQPFGPESVLQLECMQGPPGEFGLLLAGTGAADPGILISHGEFCLALQGGNAFGRYNIVGTPRNSIGRFDARGRYQNLVGTSDSAFGFLVPLQWPFGPTIQAGQTVHFQLWHRDGPGASNFSNGLSVNF